MQAKALNKCRYCKGKYQVAKAESYGFAKKCALATFSCTFVAFLLILPGPLPPCFVFVSAHLSPTQCLVQRLVRFSLLWSSFCTLQLLCWRFDNAQQLIAFASCQ